jgi:anti-sigma factor RsiW
MSDMHVTDPRCGAFEEDLSAFVDGELDAARQAELRAHAEACSACAGVIERLRDADTVLRVRAGAPAANEDVRLAALGRGLADRIARDTPRRRAPRRVRRWLAPFGVGSLAGAAAALLLLLARPTDAPPPASVPAPVAEAALPDAIAAAKARVAAQDGADAFADRGASAPAEPEAIAHLDLVERLGALTPAERAALDRDLARWEAMSPDERASLRTR